MNLDVIQEYKKRVKELGIFKQWEIECGRTAVSKQQGVIPIDLDIVVWNGEVIRATDYSRDYVSKGVAQLLHRLL